MRPPQLITSPQLSHANHTHTNGHMLTDPTMQQMQMQTRGQFLVPPVVGEQRESLLYASPSPFSPQPLPQPQPQQMQQQQQSTQPQGLPQPPAPPVLTPQINPMRSDSLDALQQLQQPRQHHSQSAGIIRGPTTGAPLPPLLSPQQLQQLSQQQLYRQQQQQQPQQQQHQQQQEYHRGGRGSSPPPVPIQQGSPPPLVVESLPRMHVGHGVSNALLDMIGEQLVGEREPAAVAHYQHHQQLLQPNPAVVAAAGMMTQHQPVPLPHSHSYRAPTGHTPVPLSSPSMDVRDVALDFTTAAAGASSPPRAATTTTTMLQQQQQHQ